MKRDTKDLVGPAALAVAHGGAVVNARAVVARSCLALLACSRASSGGVAPAGTASARRRPKSPYVAGPDVSNV